MVGDVVVVAVCAVAFVDADLDSVCSLNTHVNTPHIHEEVKLTTTSRGMQEGRDGGWSARFMVVVHWQARTTERGRVCYIMRSHGQSTSSYLSSFQFNPQTCTAYKCPL